MIIHQAECIAVHINNPEKLVRETTSTYIPIIGLSTHTHSIVQVQHKQFK